MSPTANDTTVSEKVAVHWIGVVGEGEVASVEMVTVGTTASWFKLTVLDAVLGFVAKSIATPAATLTDIATCVDEGTTSNVYWDGLTGTKLVAVPPVTVMSESTNWVTDLLNVHENGFGLVGEGVNAVVERVTVGGVAS